MEKLMNTHKYTSKKIYKVCQQVYKIYTIQFLLRKFKSNEQNIIYYNNNGIFQKD